MNHTGGKYIAVFWLLLLAGFPLEGICTSTASEKRHTGDVLVHMALPVNHIPDSSGIIRSYFQSNANYSWKLIHEITDSKGVNHARFQQYFKNIPVENAVVILHSNNGKFHALSGSFTELNKHSDLTHLSPEELLSNPMPVFHDGNNHISLKDVRQKDCSLWWQWHEANMQHRLVYRIEFSFENSLEQKTAYMEAQTGTVVSTKSYCMHIDSTGSAQTAYHGTRTISTTLQQANFVLRSGLRGSGIETINLNNRLNYSLPTDFTDADNIWEQNVPLGELHACDAHYCAEKYYDFLMYQFNRNSIDNHGKKLISYLNYGSGLQNAFWNGNAVVYGSGTSGPLTTLDIAGHEFTHGLIQRTANFNYAGEQGIINEAVADIFGTALEFFADASNADWTIGEKSGVIYRSLSHPELYNQPSSYLGTNWYYGHGDNGGVHVNSGFINRWFYLLSEGGQGMNENGQSYQIQGIGIAKAIAIVYQSLIAYSTPSTGFDDFMRTTLQGSIDLYGNCSPEYLSVFEAWKAVGLGNGIITPVEIKSSSDFTFCSGDSIKMKTTGFPGSWYTWFKNGNAVAGVIGSELNTNTGGYYHVTENRCGIQITSIPVYVTELSLPMVTTANVEFCEGSWITLSGTPSGGTYSVPNPYSGPSVTYNYRYTDATTGCSSQAAGVIIRNAVPEVKIANNIFQIPINNTPVQLSGNYVGIFTGPGVAGSIFYPETAGMGGPYPISLSFTGIDGCSATDTVHFYVTEPCKKKTETIQVTAVGIIQNLYNLKTSANSEHFVINWMLPQGCMIVKRHSENELDVLWNSPSTEFEIELVNSCMESFRVAGKIYKPTDAKVNTRLWPNPANGKIYFNTNEPSKDIFLKITFENAQGSIVKRFTSTQSEGFIDISGISAGVYSLHIESNEWKAVKKIVIN